MLNCDCCCCMWYDWCKRSVQQFLSSWLLKRLRNKIIGSPPLPYCYPQRWIQKKIDGTRGVGTRAFIMIWSFIKIDHPFPRDGSFYGCGSPKSRHWPKHWPFFFAHCNAWLVLSTLKNQKVFQKNRFEKKRKRKKISLQVRKASQKFIPSVHPTTTTLVKKMKSALSKGKIDKSMISSPQFGSFKHIAHVGYDADTGWSSEGVDPSWVALFEDLKGKGISRKIIQQEMEYIKPFVRDAQNAPERKTKPQPSPVPHRRSRVPSTDLHLQVRPPSPSPAPMNRQNMS